MNGTKRNNGFTLAEAMMATVVLSIVSVAVLVPFITGARVQAEGYRRTLAAKLAGELIELIIIEDFDNIVAKYDGYTESTGQVKDISGSIYSDTAYDNFSRKAECVYVYLNEESGNDEPLFIRVTVTVEYMGAEIAKISRLVSK
jgi:prepilin-type N-terminal cleavage/methylation domain-containing protein